MTNGRPIPDHTKRRIVSLAMQGRNPSQIARIVGCSRPTVYKYVERAYFEARKALQTLQTSEQD